MKGAIHLTINEITTLNRRGKYIKAVQALAKAMELPITIKPRDKERAEQYVYASQKDLTEKWRNEVGGIIDVIYHGICSTFKIPVIKTFSKALDAIGANARPVSEAIWYNGRIVFNPETGQPINKKDFEKIIRALEKFLNKRLAPQGRKIVLNAIALGRTMARRLLETPESELRKLKLVDIEYQGKTIEWMSESLNRQDRLFGPVSISDKKKLINAVDIAEQSMAENITKITDEIRHAVKRTIIDGMKGRLPKKQIAQRLFDRLGNVNRDWGMIVDTEMVDTFNNAFLRESSLSSYPGEKRYYKRIEANDKFTCPWCKKIRNTVALFVDKPLEDDTINDPIAKVAIWEGKDNVGRSSKNLWIAAGAQHPWCRGSWVRYFPEQENRGA